MATNFSSPPPSTGTSNNDAPAPAPYGRSGPLPIWVMGGGAAVFLGSLLPFVSANLDGLVSVDPVQPGARALSVLFGLAIVALGAVMRFGPPTAMRGVTIAALCCGAAGALGYGGFILLGLHGISEADSLGFPAQVT